MPLILGTELAEGLKRNNPHAKIILVSAFADRRLQRRSPNLDVPLLSKPFAAERLLEVVEGALAAPSNRQIRNLAYKHDFRPRRSTDAISKLEVGFDVMLGTRKPRHEGGHKRIFAELNESGNS